MQNIQRELQGILHHNITKKKNETTGTRIPVQFR